MFKNLFGKKAKSDNKPVYNAELYEEYEELLAESKKFAKKIKKNNPNKDRWIYKLDNSFSKYKGKSPEALKSLQGQLETLNRRIKMAAKR
jgi:hypothetical protein